MAFMGYMAIPPSEPTPAQLDEFLLPQAQVDDMIRRTAEGDLTGPFMLDGAAGKKFYAERTVERSSGPALVGHFALPCAIEGVIPFEVETAAIIEQ